MEKSIPEVKTPLLFLFFKFRNNFLIAVKELIKKHGNIFTIKVGSMRRICINDPDLVKHVFLDARPNYLKGILIPQTNWNNIYPVLGARGILTTDDETLWRKDRILINSRLHKEYVTRYAEIFTLNSQTMLDRWLQNQDHWIDLKSELSCLALINLSTTLFHGVNIPFAEFDHAIRTLSEQIYHQYTSGPLKLRWKLPTRSRYLFQHSLQFLKKTTEQIITERLKNRSEHDDLLAELLNTYQKADGTFDIQQVKAELETLLIAGEETTSSMLTWLLIVTAKHPLVEKKLREEIDTVLKNRTPRSEDLSSLPYLRAMMQETLRLYPPGYSICRVANEADQIKGYSIPKGAECFVPVIYLHRDPDFWPEPEEFKPERFLTAPYGQANQYAYIPFGAGLRMCAGRNFAMLEIALTFIMILQKFHFRLPDNFVSRYDFGVTLWAKGDVKIKVSPKRDLL